VRPSYTLDNIAQWSTHVLDAMSDALIRVDGQGTVQYVNPEAERLLGLSGPALRHRFLWDALPHLFDRDTSAALRATLDTGRPYLFQAHPSGLETGGDTEPECLLQFRAHPDPHGGMILLFRDVSRQSGVEARLERLDRFDPLTSLANRTALFTRLSALGTHGTRDLPFAIVLIDLDRFKDINDSLGHEAGDFVLIQISSRVAGLVNADTFAARLSGDEFVIVIEHADAAHALDIAHRALAEITRPIVIAGRDIVLSASIGVAASDAHCRDGMELLKRASQASRQAKDSGRFSVVAYRDVPQAAVAPKYERERDIRRALENDEFFLVFQPQVRMSSGSLIGAEALIRWRHPQRGIVGPDAFLALAEETRLIVDIGNWVVAAAARQVAAWRAAGLRPPPISINVSARQIFDGSIYDGIKAALECHDLNGGDLVLEITESVFLGNEESYRDVLVKIAALGVPIALDDFGTGYASLAYVARFPFSTLKIDRIFVSELLQRGSSRSIVQAVIALAEGLNMDVLAEGVETEAQAEELRALGCDLAQGFLYRQGLPAEPFAAEYLSTAQADA
jgi:diguanylate cyclase (GGDEF)-like protein